MRCLGPSARLSMRPSHSASASFTACFTAKVTCKVKPSPRKHFSSVMDAATEEATVRPEASRASMTSACSRCCDPSSAPSRPLRSATRPAASPGLPSQPLGGSSSLNSAKSLEEEPPPPKGPRCPRCGTASVPPVSVTRQAGDWLPPSVAGPGSATAAASKAAPAGPASGAQFEPLGAQPSASEPCTLCGPPLPPAEVVARPPCTPSQGAGRASWSVSTTRRKSRTTASCMWSCVSASSRTWLLSSLRLMRICALQARASLASCTSSSCALATSFTSISMLSLRFIVSVKVGSKPSSFALARAMS
mmetsp:Transcript_116896/g.325764  ORF Transcript_116896/g.325764 Transcript_116896/m.325764 type:complete len:305 (+) Transcript_116896:173-1087(+)